MDSSLTSSDLIDGIQVTPLDKIGDNRGMVLHMMKNTSNLFCEFGEVYFSVVYKNSIKAWKKHLKMTLNLAVPSGCVKIVCYDERIHSKTHGKINEFFLSRENYCLLSIPPLIWYGFMGMSDGESLIANCADMIHDSLEVERMVQNDRKIPYMWV